MTSHNAVARRAPVPKPPLLTPIGLSSPSQAERDAWLRGVLSDRRLRSMSKVIAIQLSFCKTDPTYDELGKTTGCDRRTAMRAVARLVACGWLEKVASRGRVPNQFRRVMRVARALGDANA